MNVSRRLRRRCAFSLIEVMIAMAVFFMVTFAILGLTTQLLQNSRSFQSKKIPPVSLVHAWYTSMTNRVTEGEKSYEFSDISGDLGDLYNDYNFVINAMPDPDMTNGLWDVTSTYYWDPNSQSRHVGEGRK
jgi:Tfp pilus assembly protein PilV